MKSAAMLALVLSGLAAAPAHAQVRALLLAGGEQAMEEEHAVYRLDAVLELGAAEWAPTVGGLAALATHPNPSAPDDDVVAVVFAPLLGLRKQTRTGSIGGAVGYLFVDDEAEGVVRPLVIGSRDGVFARVVGEYWGAGARRAQLIGSYAFEDGAWHLRLRAEQRVLALSTGGAYLGPEAGTQYGAGYEAWFVGAVGELTVAHGVGLLVGAGYRSSDPLDQDGPYLRAELTVVP